MVRNAMSATEFYILQYLWTRETPATFSEIMVHFNETEHKEWKKQTVNTFLSRLSQKGFLNIDKSGEPFTSHLSQKRSSMNSMPRISLKIPIRVLSRILSALSLPDIN